MTHSENSQMHIFLVQPLSKCSYKEMIVYADTEQDARHAAAIAGNDENTSTSTAEFSPETVYHDTGMSICIEINPDVVKVLENNLDCVRLQYNEVTYDLKKNVAQEVIVENVLSVNPSSNYFSSND